MNITTFIDSVGRNIIAEHVSSNGAELVVKNPAMINVVPSQNGQLQVQLIPLFFAEFIDQSSRADGTTWTYNLGTVTVGTVAFDGRLVEQYFKVFSMLAPTAPAGDPVIKLFDDEAPTEKTE
jgi:hypothetical protein